MLPTNREQRSAGFTVIEVLIIVPILALVVTGMVAFMVALLNSDSIAQVKLESTYDAQAALDIMDGDVNITKTFLLAPDTNMTDPYGPDNAGSAWTYTTNSDNTAPVLILRMYATTTNVQNSNKLPVYINQNGCSGSALTTNPAYTVNVIYFVRGGTLYRRVLTDTSQTLCSTPYQVQTCPPDAPQPVNTICKGVDETVLTNVSDFRVQFWDSGRRTLPMTQLGYDTVTSVDFYVTTTRQASGSTVVFGTDRFTTRRNT